MTTGGFLNLIKPPALSSHDAVNAVRRILQTKKIGHAGTLDPAAAGVLPLAVAGATALLPYLPSDKTYRAEIRLGIATDSGDETGMVTDEKPDFAMPTAECLREVLAEFVGDITQTPPLCSAIKINGQRAYKLMKHDEPIDMPSRQVHIEKISLLDICADSFFVDVDCSKGTYIRSLATDIGKRLGIPATLAFLMRTRVGGFVLDDACTLEELTVRKEELLLSPEKYLAKTLQGFGSLAHVELPQGRIRAFCNGLSSRLPNMGQMWQGSSSLLAVVFADGKFLGIGRYDGEDSCLYPVKVYQH